MSVVPAVSNTSTDTSATADAVAAERSNGSRATSGAILERVVLVVAVFAPVIDRLPRLGFYGDDWAFLASMYVAPDQSYVGALQALFAHDNAVRPLMWAVLAALYQLFGLAPLGYHLVNAAVLALSMVLLHACLRQLHEPPLLAIAVPLLYALLPHYSTDRLWISTIQANASACLFFASCFADARSLAPSARFWGWRAGALACLIASGLAYEVFLPLFVVGPVLIALRRREAGRASAPADAAILRRRVPIVLATNVIAIGGLVLVKALMTTRDVAVAHGGYLGWVAQQLRRALVVSYGDHVLMLPRTIALIVRTYATWPVLLAAGALGVMVTVILLRRSASESGRGPAVTRRRMLGYVVAGFVVFVGGFLIYPPDPTMTGVNNRALNAASIGVAFTLVGALGWVALSLPAARRWWPRVFAAGLGTLGAAGYLTVHTVAGFWADSYERQRAVLGAIHASLPTMQVGTSLILDGVCPYSGPVMVFDTTWDLAGALTVLYGHAGIRADIAAFSNTSVRSDGVAVRTYGGETTYPYGRVVVYDFHDRAAHALDTAAEAQAYFAAPGRAAEPDCPLARHGFGVPIFGKPLRIGLARRL